MSRWKLKECPRCGGDIFMDIEENGWLGHCLQCGYMGQRSSALVGAPARVEPELLSEPGNPSTGRAHSKVYR